jgi:hypothetical protein
MEVDLDGISSNAKDADAEGVLEMLQLSRGDSTNSTKVK